MAVEDARVEKNRNLRGITWRVLKKW